jgi:hypothetical protein
MGATNWEIYVPYQKDITQALDVARQTIFALGYYQKPYADTSLLNEEYTHVPSQGNFFTTNDEGREILIKDYGLDALRAPLARMGVEAFEQWIHHLDRAIKLETMEELMCLSALSSDGTSSILDIDKISDTPMLCCACPVASEDILRWFKTSTPTHDQVERCLNSYDDYEDIYEEIDRGEARYLVVYEAEIPSEIFFFGYSVD